MEATSGPEEPRTAVKGHNQAGEGTRTPNLLITNQLLYQLSYASARRK